MQTSFVLRQLICTSLALGGLAVASDAFASCGDYNHPCQGDGTTTVGTPPPDTDPPCWSCENDNYYDDNNGGSGSNGNPNPQAPLACLELMDQGQPEGCNEAVAKMGTPIANFTPDGFNALMASLPFRTASAVRGTDRLARFTLAECYANLSKDPATCEQRYYEVWMSYDQTTSDWTAQQHEYLRDIQGWIYVAQYGADANRTIASRLSFLTTFSFYRMSIPIDGVAAYVLVDPLNAAMVAARKQRRCELWHAAWDANYCSNY